MDNKRLLKTSWKDSGAFWKDLTGHEVAFHNKPFSKVYDYDAADDGPEVEIITRIEASHPGMEIWAEGWNSLLRRYCAKLRSK